MNGARNTQPPHSARLSRGDRGGLCCVMTFFRGLVCVIVAFSIALLPLDAHFNSGLENVCIQKSEAHANPAVIAGAGAALSALALELGISETALIAGICAVGVGATGLAFYNSSRTDVALPGWKPWDDLTPQQKQDWVGQDGTSEDYYNQQIAWWALQAGILEQTPNGGLQPTEEPDPSNDPNGHSNWQKARNVLIALAAGGGAVAFNEAVGPLVDNAAASIKEMLFGSDDVQLGSLDIDYRGRYNIPLIDRHVYFMTMAGSPEYSNPTNPSETTKYRWSTNSWWAYFHNSSNYTYIRTKYPGATMYEIPGDYEVNGNVKFFRLTTYGQGGDLIFTFDSSNQIENIARVSSATSSMPNNDGGQYYNFMNANYAGGYRFKDSNGNTVATYSNGTWTGNVLTEEIDYGQMSDTPSGITNNILNQTNLSNFYDTYTSDTPSDYKRALTVPANFNDPNYTPQYSDFVNVTPEDDITTIPSNEQLPSPDPDNPPTPDDQYQQDFGQTVGQLLSQPFNQLFPFCLIGDLYTLTQKIEAAIYPEDSLSTQDVVVLNGTSELVVPLDDFGVEGMDDIVLDLTPVLQFGNLVRPWTTAIFIVWLLVGTFRFFINRGGE